MVLVSSGSISWGYEKTQRVLGVPLVKQMRDLKMFSYGILVDLDMNNPPVQDFHL
jgi:hypothetical protein